MEITRRNVGFKATTSKHADCICDACHDTDRVTMITLPKTKYFDGETLSTEYRYYWLCERCRVKLIRALNGGRNEA